jgi:phage baseplate assembly protein W
MQKRSTSFLGTGWAFPPEFNRTAATVNMVSDEEDIRQSLRILLTTSIGERCLQPSYGCDLRGHLFEPLDATTRAFLTELLRTAILHHEPRIDLEKIIVSKRVDEGVLDIELVYVVRSTNSRFNYVFPFYLDEGTELRK